MRQIDLAAYPVPWDEEQLRHASSEVNIRASDAGISSPVGSPADYPSAALPTSPNKKSAFTWMAGRIHWELRLEELRRTRASEPSPPPTTPEKSG
jgi:hypothetical protein